MIHSGGKGREGKGPDNLEYTLESKKVHATIYGSEEKIQLVSRHGEYECRSNELEKKSRQSEEEELKLEELLATKQTVLQGEMSCLKEELDQRRLDVEGVKKEFDRHKQKHDMLMGERDEVNAKIHNLMLEASFGSNHLANMEKEILEQKEEICSYTWSCK
ncbi:hypothetical protein Fmac_007434 [Flemingia macrophylla]|uniref:Uncharacterized protein n=1 Tax=Flemingia macrophylla TaxID=520843 RepID=A0ABD1MUL6_9FABA